jgi:hypothetical protein
VEHERQSFRRLQLLEDDEQRQADRVGEHRVRLGPFVLRTERADDRIRHVHVQGILPARRSRSQHVQAHARHDRRQPSPQVVDTTDIRAAQSDPGFLDGVLRLADRSEHAIRDRPHVRSVLFELLGEPLRCGIGHIPPTGQPAAMFNTDDVKGDYERIRACGAEFTMPPTDVTASTIARLNDTCGNLIQLTQLAR